MPQGILPRLGPTLWITNRDGHGPGYAQPRCAQYYPTAKGSNFPTGGAGGTEQIGRVERRNAMLKHMMQKVIMDTEAVGRDSVDMILTESITAINEMARHDGFAPAQWVLSKLPRQPATLGGEREASDIGTMQAHVDGPTAFALQSEYRQKARERFVEWDCSQRIQRGILRNAQPIGGPYEVGDIVSYCRPVSYTHLTLPTKRIV